MLLFKRKETFYIRYSGNNGKLKTVSTKTDKKNLAVKFLSEFQKVIEKQKQQGFTSISFNDLSLKFLLANKHSYSDSTLRNLKNIFSQFSQHTGNTKTDYIDKKLLTDYLNSRKSKHVQKLHYSNLRTLFNYAVENNYILINPLKEIKKPKTPQKLPAYLTESELTEILQYCNDARLSDFIQFAFYTGLRLSEIISLQWQNINFRNKTVLLNNQNAITKSKKPRMIPLATVPFEILSRKKQNDSKYVFVNALNEKYKPDFISKQFKKLVRLTEFNQSLHFHSLRHSFASVLVCSGTPIQYVKELLGHSDISTTLIYSHLSNDVLSNAIYSTFNH